jgi:hypothetical protein
VQYLDNYDDIDDDDVVDDNDDDVDDNDDDSDI